MARTPRTRLAWVILAPIIGLWMIIGCGPANLAMLVMPWSDDKVEPKCKLADKNKEITVVLAARFESLEVRPDLMTADQELAEALARELRNRFKDNNEKVKIVPPIRVRPHLQKLRETDDAGLLRVGEQFQADYVLAIDIQKLSILMPSSYNSLFQGHADLSVRLLDAHAPILEAVKFHEYYHLEHPRGGAEDISGINAGQFRQKFVGRMARDLTRWFAAYPSDQKYDID
jgi:hypothetical protein